jgi:glycosyltransferase involved in cell wall biosynthesis
LIPAPARSAVRNLLWVLRHAPRLYEADDLDVLWLPNVTWAPNVVTPIVSTIHDITEFRLPQKVDPLRGLYRRRAMPRLAWRSNHIVSVSETTKQDIVKEFRLNEDKVTVVPNGVSADFSPDRRAGFRELPRSWGLRQPYVLYVGTLDHPSKNAATLLRGFALARPELPRGTQLVLAGTPAKGYTRLLAIANKLDLGPTALDARWLGFVPDETLPPLYAGASVFVSPSLYEGFGLPVLEAMASGVPTITSDVGAHREVSGDAAVLVPPLDAAAVADAIVMLFRDQAVARERTRRGLERAKRFTWDRAARTTFDIITSSARNAKGSDRSEDEAGERFAAVGT